MLCASVFVLECFAIKGGAKAGMGYCAECTKRRAGGGVFEYFSVIR